MIAICFATNNRNKIQEVQVLAGPFFSIQTLEEIGCQEELPETQTTIEGNSYQKAKYVHDHYGASCFADDTGLEVEALNGEPGVYSARYASLHGVAGRDGDQHNSENNIDLLLSKLKREPNRKAKFRTVITLIEPGGVKTFEGVLMGTILDKRKGNSGFGYDPVFLPEGSTKTLAEMTAVEKGTISHRGQAMRKLLQYLNQKYGGSSSSL
jgi:XTP/dITP diphosphohydrolase